MKLADYSAGIAVSSSLAVALVLTLLPLPVWAGPWKPAWVALALIYWCMAVPLRIGVGTGWGLGILLDIHSGTLLGQHALGLSVVAYFSHRLHQQVRVLPLWQQGLSVFVLVLVQNVITLWINGIQGRPVDGMAFLSAPITSMLLWPWVFIILRDVRRRYRVH